MVFGSTVGQRNGVRAEELAFFDGFYASLLGAGAPVVSSGAGRP